MTLPQAHETARNGAERFGNSWRVFRLSAWPGGVYSCKAGELPAEVNIVATYPIAASARPAAVKPVAPAPEPQGSLF